MNAVTAFAHREELLLAQLRSAKDMDEAISACFRWSRLPASLRRMSLTNLPASGSRPCLPACAVRRSCSALPPPGASLSPPRRSSHTKKILPRRGCAA